MRTLSLLVIALATAGCHVSKLGEECGLSSFCAEGTRCVEGVCASCGGLGETCCSEPGGSAEICDGDVACVGEASGYGTCDGECGQEHLPCCDGEGCSDGTTCHLGTCTDLSGGGGGGTSECNDPSGQEYKVYVIDAFCNPHPHTIQATTPEKAEECRQGLSATGIEVCPLGEVPMETHACGYPTFPETIPNDVLFSHCSEAQLKFCEENTCGSDTCTWTETTGACSP